jgi:predicted HAD superfamily Cof-like phosphohydrolase
VRDSKSEGEGSFMGAGVAAESVLAAVHCSRMQKVFRKRRESKRRISLNKIALARRVARQVKISLS